MRRGETPGLSWFSLHSDPDNPQPSWSEIGCGGEKVLDQEWKAKNLLRYCTNNHISMQQSTSSAMMYPLPTSRGHSAQCLLLPPGPGHVFISGHCLQQGAYRTSQLHGNTMSSLNLLPITLTTTTGHSDLDALVEEAGHLEQLCPVAFDSGI